MDRDQAIFRMAMVLAHNTCIQKSDRFNADDETIAADAAAECAREIRGWVDITIDKSQLKELLHESGYRDPHDFMSQALNEGDGVYRP